MKYKVGDRVKIKSLDWYNKNKNKRGNISFPYEAGVTFTSEMSPFCGQIVTISQKCYTQDVGFYHIREDDEFYRWTDEMIERLEEGEKNSFTETLIDTVKESKDRHRIVVDPRFDVEVDEGEYYIVRRKKEYPKTYEECCKVMNYCYSPVATKTTHREELIRRFQFLILYRDAYWKIAGEEMGLGKPWEPDWKNSKERRYSIVNIEGNINLPETILTKWILKVTNKILVFPTEEMRDAFYENFKSDIEICKELL